MLLLGLGVNVRVKGQGWDWNQRYGQSYRSPGYERLGTKRIVYEMPA